MGRATITIQVEVPDWATTIAVDADGTPVAMHPCRNDESVGIHTDEESESWYGGMCKPLRVVNWRQTRQTVRPATKKERCEMAERNEVNSTDLLADYRFVARQILLVRDALVEGDVDQAYYELYRIADREFTSTTPWACLEELANDKIGGESASPQE